MKGYIAVCLVIVLWVGFTKSLTSEDQKKAQAIIKNYCENPQKPSKSDLKTTLENAFNVKCEQKTTGLFARRQKRAGPFCRWIRRVIAEIK